MDKTELEAKTIKELRVIAEKLGTRRLNAHTRKEDIIKAILEVSGENGTKSEKAPEKADDKSDKKAVKSESKPAKSSKPATKASDKPAKAEEASDSSKKPAAKKGKATNAKPKAIDPDLSALLDALEGKAEDEEEAEDAVVEAAEEEKAEEVEAEPAPVEPDSVYIDRGAILPEYLPGTCLFALVRDPGTIFVYWNAEFESERGWLLTAYDKGGNILQQFTTPVRRSGRGYFRVPSSLAARVTLSAISANGQSEVKLESKIRIAEQLGIAQPNPNDERWVDFKSREVISEAPAPGRAPNAPYIEQMGTPAIAGGGFDRSVEKHDHPFGSMSSRFGSLNAPGSSDILVGSSDTIIRRR